MTNVKPKSIIYRHDQWWPKAANGANPPATGAAPRMPARQSTSFIMCSCGGFGIHQDREKNDA